MTCLPLKYLNGWLFRIDLSRYTGERLQKMEEYQEECYDVLHDYFWHGGAINPEATPVQLQIMQARIEFLMQFVPEGVKGAISAINGRVRGFLTRSYWRSKPRKPEEVRAAKHPDLFEEVGR